MLFFKYTLNVHLTKIAGFIMDEAHKSSDFFLCFMLRQVMLLTSAVFLKHKITSGKWGGSIRGHVCSGTSLIYIMGRSVHVEGLWTGPVLMICLAISDLKWKPLCSCNNSNVYRGSTTVIYEFTYNCVAYISSRLVFTALNVRKTKVISETIKFLFLNMF